MWDGLFPALIQVVTVVAGVWLAQRLSDKARAREDRDDAAAAVGIAIGDLRDAATISDAGFADAFDLWPLRNEMFRARRALGGAGSADYLAVEEFYARAVYLRSWSRRHWNAARTRVS